jgi:hypothetical protein
MKLTVAIYTVALLLFAAGRADAYVPTPKDAAPCTVEDGSDGNLPCYWDGQNVGNKIGLSYYISPDGVFIYDKRWTTKDGRVTKKWELKCRNGKHDKYHYENGFEWVKCER